MRTPSDRRVGTSTVVPCKVPCVSTRGVRTWTVIGRKRLGVTETCLNLYLVRTRTVSGLTSRPSRLPLHPQLTSDTVRPRSTFSPSAGEEGIHCQTTRTVRVVHCRDSTPSLGTSPARSTPVGRVLDTYFDHDSNPGDSSRGSYHSRYTLWGSGCPHLLSLSPT